MKIGINFVKKLGQMILAIYAILFYSTFRKATLIFSTVLKMKNLQYFIFQFITSPSLKTPIPRTNFNDLIYSSTSNEIMKL